MGQQGDRPQGENMATRRRGASRFFLELSCQTASSFSKSGVVLSQKASMCQVKGPRVKSKSLVSCQIGKHRRLEAFSRVVVPDSLEFFKKRGRVKSKSLKVSSQRATCKVEKSRVVSGRKASWSGFRGRPEPYGWHAPVPLAPSPSFRVFTSPSLACGCPSLGCFLSKSLCGLQRVSAPHSSYPSPKMSSL